MSVLVLGERLFKPHPPVCAVLGFTGPLPAVEPMEKVGGQCRMLLLVCCGELGSRETVSGSSSGAPVSH